MTDGYIYCFSNVSMPGLLKIGMTTRVLKDRLNEANASNTWKPPTPYKIEFAKKVKNPCEKEKTLHILLEQYTIRVNLRREFFDVSKEEVLKFFDLMDGDMWEQEPIVFDEDEDDNDEENNEKESSSILMHQSKKLDIKKCRDMAKCFTHGQRIRHIIGINKIWIGAYDSIKNGIVYEGGLYTSLSNFAETHHKRDNTNRSTFTANGWKQCEYEVDGNWISTNTFPA